MDVMTPSQHIVDKTLENEIAESSYSDQQPSPLLPVLKLFWRFRLFLFRLTLSGLGLFTVIAFLIPKQYDATTLLMPPDSQANSALTMLAGMTGNGGLGAYAADLLGVRGSGALYIGVLHSQRVQDNLVKHFNLKKRYHASRMIDARKRLDSKTFLSEDRKNGIVIVTVRDWDPNVAAALSLAYVEELNQTLAEVSTSSARRERIFLEGRLQDAQRDLELAEQEFSKFASENTAIDIPQQGKAMVESAATLQGNLIAAQSQLSGLQQIYADSNVRVRSLKARINELQRQLEGLKGGNEANGASESMYPSIRRLPLLGVKYADLFRRTKVDEAVFETLTQQYELAKVEEAKEIPTVRVLDPASPPEKKSYPHRLVIMLVGAIFSFAFGMAWIIFGDSWRRTPTCNPWKQFAIEVMKTILHWRKTKLLISR